MLRSSLAQEPYALMAIVCTVTAIVAPITLTEYKYAIFLALITFDSLILCQYRRASALPACHPLLMLLRKLQSFSASLSCHS